jgi:hypothetical protein
MALFAFLLVDHWLPGVADTDPSIVFRRIG